MASNTVLAYGKDLSLFLASCDNYLSQEDFSSCAQYWLQHSRRTLAPTTVKRRLSSLRTFARWAEISNELDEYRAPRPLKANAHPLPEGRPGIYRMLAATDVLEYRVLIALLGMCGLRISEALSIRASSFRRSAAGDMMLTVRGKGDKTRRIPTSAAAWRVVEEAYCRSLLTDDQPLVSLGNRHARRAITQVGRRARLMQRVASHDLRATFATDLLDSGVNLRIIQELLGHSSLAVTEIYLGVTDNKMREAVNR